MKPGPDLAIRESSLALLEFQAWRKRVVSISRLSSKHYGLRTQCRRARSIARRERSLSSLGDRTMARRARRSRRRAEGMRRGETRWSATGASNRVFGDRTSRCGQVPTRSSITSRHVVSRAARTSLVPTEGIARRQVFDTSDPIIITTEHLSVHNGARAAS